MAADIASSIEGMKVETTSPYPAPVIVATMILPTIYFMQCYEPIY